MRRAARFALAVPMLVLAACGSGESILDAGNDPSGGGASATTGVGSTTPAVTQPGETTTTAAPVTTVATPLDDLPPCPVDALADASGTVDVTFWHGMTGVLEDALVALTNEYNASQSKVRVTIQNQGGYEQTLDKYIQSGQSNRPDLVQLPEYTVQLMADTDSVIPIGACIEASSFDTEPFLPRALAAYATEGVQWSMPFNVSDPVLYYNKSMFRAAGLDPEAPPVSLEDLRAASQQIVDSGAASYGIAFDTGFDSGGGWFVEQWFAKLHEFYADNENGRSSPATRVLYDGPAAIDLFTQVQSMVLDGIAVNVGDNASGQDSFLKMADRTSPAAMTIGTSAALGTVLSVVNGGLIPGITAEDIGVGPMPGPGGAPGVLVGGASLWIVDGRPAESSAAAWDYIQFLVSAAAQSTWASATGYVPIREDAVELEPLATTYATDPRFKVAYDQLTAEADDPSANGPILGPLREVRVVTARAVADIMNGADVQTSLSTAAAQANALIADYTARNP
ncbi:MAG: ABC transporter substrate-binding protein [Acidimicrobiia bacterium]